MAKKYSITTEYEPIEFTEKKMVIGRISFSTPRDIHGEIIKYTFATADTEYEIKHHLGRVPQFVFQSCDGKAGIIYKGDTEWNKKKIYLKSSVANNTVTLLLL